MNRRIPIRDWPAFFSDLAGEHRAWLTTIERDDGIEVFEEPLQSISVGTQTLDIRVGGQTIHIDQPRVVTVEESAEGALQVMRIDDTSGRQVHLHFRVAVAPGVLDGIAPAEL